MKKLISFTFILCVILGICSFGVSAYENEAYYKNTGLEGTEINVFNWGEYISDGSEDSYDTNLEFEKYFNEKKQKSG